MSLWLGVGVVAALFWLVSRRANEVFCLSVRGGEALLLRGAITPGLRHALMDVVRRAGVERATLRGVRRDRRAVLDVAGVDERLAQRLRNVFDSHGGPRIGLSQPPPRGARNLGQRLGWAWLAWRLRR